MEAENLLLRRELAVYEERAIRPRRVDAATRLSQLFDWRGALVMEPQRTYPAVPSRLAPDLVIQVMAGAPVYPCGARQYIRRVAIENPLGSGFAGGLNGTRR
jgi:hypothetical protein